MREGQREGWTEADRHIEMYKQRQMQGSTHKRQTQAQTQMHTWTWIPRYGQTHTHTHTPPIVVLGALTLPAGAGSSFPCSDRPQAGDQPQ